VDGKKPVPGVSLIEVLRHKSTFDEPALKGVLLPLADALEQAHDAHKLHLSISPATIVLQGGATPVLIGLEVGAKAPPDPGYSAIERYSAEYKTGRWTDIYSLGAVAYRLISGQPPPPAGARIEGEAMRPAVEIGARTYHKSLLEAIDWALKVHPLERPQNLAQWKDALIGLRDNPPNAGAAGAATVPITATMVRKFAEARQAKPASAAVTPMPPHRDVQVPRAQDAQERPPPLVEKPAPPPPAFLEKAKATPAAVPSPPAAAPAAQAKPPRIAPPPPQDEPFPESPPTRPSLWSAVIAVIVLGSAIGYAWFAQRPKAPLPVVVTEQAVEQVQPPTPTPATPPAAPAATPPAALVENTPAPPAAPVAEVPAVAPAESDPQVRMTRELAAKLQGDWAGHATFALMLRGLDCSAAVTRNWTTTIKGASADGRSIVGTFSTVLQADGDKSCRKAHYDIQVDGDFSARVVSASSLQLNARVSGCSGNCEDNRGLLAYKMLNRTYRVTISPKVDRLSFSDNATDFVLRKR
jgi:hypothetical protein